MQTMLQCLVERDDHGFSSTGPKVPVNQKMALQDNRTDTLQHSPLEVTAVRRKRSKKARSGGEKRKCNQTWVQERIVLELSLY